MTRLLDKAMLLAAAITLMAALAHCVDAALHAPDGTRLPDNHPQGQSMESWMEQENIWPQGCAIPQLTER